MLFISRNNQQLGSFPEEEVARGLQDGRFLPTDLGWKEGMEQWQPLSTFHFGAPPVLPVPAGGHYPGLPAEPAARAGLPWEKPGGFFSRWWETTLDALISPSRTFRGMKTTGGLGPPLVYLAICTTLLYLASLLGQLLYQIILASLGLAENVPDIPMFSALAIGLSLVMGVVIVPLATLLTAFLGGALFHLCLLIFGGAREGFEGTCRATCYMSGALNVLQIIPILGPLVTMFWGPVAFVIALKETHQTDTWRAVCAVALLYLMCCGVILAIVLSAVGLAASALHSGAG
ncbi:MAG: YIP1 family protein [Terrimicrobiaceae bacterium]|nr:YIP1 family protein [Terrimicrobiaceae bacterium]